jgi:eukaryotic-like serine/threonine-protein kinase
MTLGVAIESVDDERDARPSVRAAGRAAIDPELDALCVKALARDAAARFPTARALHDQLERYLDGDLDRQRRREQALAHVEHARVAEQAGSLAERTVAMQEINRALALDPTNEPARRAMVRMLVEPPKALPPSARDELQRSRTTENRLAFRVGALGFLSMYLFLPFYLWMGIRDWTLAGAVLGLIAVSSALLWWGAHVPGRARVALVLTILSAGVLIALLTRVVGPFASAPVLAFGMAVGLTFNPSGTGMLGLVSFVAIALVAPTLGELAGVLAPSYAAVDGSIVVVPHLTALPPLATGITLTLTSLSTITLAGLYLTRLHNLLQTTQERLFAYSWNVRQFLPELPTGS